MAAAAMGNAGAIRHNRVVINFDGRKRNAYQSGTKQSRAKKIRGGRHTIAKATHVPKSTVSLAALFCVKYSFAAKYMERLPNANPHATGISQTAARRSNSGEKFSIPSV